MVTPAEGGGWELTSVVVPDGKVVELSFEGQGWFQTHICTHVSDSRATQRGWQREGDRKGV